MTDREEFEKWFKAEWNADYYPTEAMYQAWQARGEKIKELEAKLDKAREALERIVNGDVWVETEYSIAKTALEELDK